MQQQQQQQNQQQQTTNLFYQNNSNLANTTSISVGRQTSISESETLTNASSLVNNRVNLINNINSNFINSGSAILCSKRPLSLTQLQQLNCYLCTRSLVSNNQTLVKSNLAIQSYFYFLRFFFFLFFFVLFILLDCKRTLLS